jgi:acyl carrier protein
METVSDQIKWFITHHVLAEDDDPAAVHPGTNLREAGILSSLWIIRLVSFIEERFRINLDAMDVAEDNFTSINTIERLIRDKMARAS